MDSLNLSDDIERVCADSEQIRVDNETIYSVNPNWLSGFGPNRDGLSSPRSIVCSAIASTGGNPTIQRTPRNHWSECRFSATQRISSGMASPFEIFRKNQRLWMAGAVLVAIISFVVAPMLEYFSGAQGGQSGSNPVVASWNGGVIRQKQVAMDEGDLILANRFLGELASAVMAKGGIPAVPGFQPEAGSVGITQLNNSPEEVILFRRLMLSEAARHGIQFDDKAAKLFLQRFVDGKLNGSEIQAIMVKSTDRRLTMPQFTRFIKDELAFQEMERLTTSGLFYQDVRDSRVVGFPALSTPSKNWREYLRLNQTAKIRAYPVNVRDFLDKVTETPSEKQLKELYEAGRGIIRTAGMLDSQPAFMLPATANIEFASIDLEKVITEEMAKISEDVLRAEYETRVKANQFRVPIEAEKKPDTSGLPPAGTPAATPEKAAAPAETPAIPTEAPAVPTETPAVPEEKPAAPAAEAPKPPVLDNPGESSGESQSRLAPRRNDVRLVSFQEEKPQSAEQTPAGTTPPAAPVPSTSEPSTPTTPDNPVAPAPAASVESKPAEPAQAPASTEPTAALNLGEKPAEPTQNATVPDAPAVTPMRTQTFDEVKSQIAREMATATATKIVDDKFEQVYSAMRIYQAELSTYQNQIKQPGSEKVEAPVKPDLNALAKEYGLDYGTTGVVNSEAIALMPIGRSSVNVGASTQPIPVPRFVEAVSGLGEAFNPLQSVALAGQSTLRFVFWKTELELPSTPSFEAAKENVAAVWKVQEAQKLAETSAKETAGRVGSSGQIGDALTSDIERKLVVEPSPFTAMNRMFLMFMQLRMSGADEVSQIDQLQPVDMGFMETVFAAKPGETVVAPDRQRTVYYVVHLIEKAPPIEELLANFQRAPTEGVSALVSRSNQQSIQAMQMGIESRLGFRRY